MLSHIVKIHRVAALGALLLFAHAPSLFGVTESWTGGSGTTSNWNDATNWSMAIPANGDALIFGSPNARTTNFDNIASLSVTDITFSASAAAYTLHITNGAMLTLTGTGIVNNSSNTQTIINDEGTSGGGITFSNSSIAANLNVTNIGTTTSSGHSGGSAIFSDSANASTATITNNGGTANGSVEGATFFNNTSSAGSATIINNAGTVGGASGGTTFFGDSSTAATATITNNGGPGASGDTYFKGSSTAGSAVITNNGGTTLGNAGGITQFWDNSSAGSATIIAYGGTSGGTGGVITFLVSSDGGTSRIEVFGNGRLDISSHIGAVTVGSIEGDGNVFLSGTNGSSLTVGSNNLNTTFSGVIQDGGTGGSLTKIGTGTLTLSGANTFTGGTTVTAGTLLINNSAGSGTGTGSVQVTSGTLGGTGTIAGAVTVGSGSGTGAFISPGASLGTLTIQSVLTLNSDATYKFELNSGTAVADKILANGLTINSASFSFTDLGSSKFAIGTTFVVIDNTSKSAIKGFFTNLADHSIFSNNGNTYEVSYEGGDGNDLVLNVVPEPPIGRLLITGMALLAIARWRVCRNDVTC